MQQQQQRLLDWSFLDNGVLYDRAIEQEKLFAAYHKRLSNESCNEFILLAGKSGTGKTALAQTLRHYVSSTEVGGFFVSGKFDQLQKSEPYAALVSAFTEYATLLVNHPNQTYVREKKEEIQTSLRTDIQLLTDMIPALEQIVSCQSGSSSIRGTKATQRLFIATRNLVRTISSPTKPLVLFLDDLQWADSATIDLLRVLASDKKCPGLVLIGACRYDEVEFEDEFAEFLRTIENEDQVSIVPIELHNLTLEAVEDIVSDVLHIPKEDSRPLFRAVYKKTKGNILFVVQALESLCDNEILSRDNDGRWQWDTEDLKAWGKGVSNVMDLMTHRIQLLSSDVQTVLVTAACFGAEFDEYLLTEILSETDVSSAVDEAVESGLLVQLHGGGFYKFAHDRVQQAAYSLLPKEEKARVHLDIGRKLRTNLSEEDIEMHLYLVVDQMERGGSLLDDQNEKDELATLCLRAGQMATRCSDFKAAAKYFALGIDSLSERNWRDQYYLSLDLYNAVAEAKYCTADFDVMDKYLSEVFSNARSLHDKMSAHLTKIYSLGARHQLKEACETGFALLEDLNEKIPSNPSRPRIMAELFKTGWMLRGKSDEDIIGQPPMCDPDKIAAMSVLNLLTIYVWVAEFDRFTFISCRMVQLSIKYGSCAVSAHGFACYAILMATLKKLEETKRFSTLGLKLFESYKINEWLPRVHFVVYGMLYFLTRPIWDIEEPLQNVFQVGLETGDVEFSMVGLHAIKLYNFVRGKTLEEQNKDSASALEIMAEYKQELLSALLCPAVQGIQNLLGHSEDPCVLTGEIIEQEKYMEIVESSCNITASFTLSLWRMIIAYIMGDYELAVDMAEKSRPFQRRTGIASFMQWLYDGLSSLAYLQEFGKERRKHLTNAKRTLKYFKKLSRWCPDNFANKVFLLEAEFLSLKGKLDLAIPMYQHSIELAEIGGFLHEEAFTNERAGLALRHCGDAAGSVSFLKKAYYLYEKWGSTPKVEQLSKKFSFLSQS